MTDKRISELDVLATVDALDLVPILTAADGLTRRALVSALLDGSLTGVDDLSAKLGSGRYLPKMGSALVSVDDGASIWQPKAFRDLRDYTHGSDTVRVQAAINDIEDGGVGGTIYADRLYSVADLVATRDIRFVGNHVPRADPYHVPVNSGFMRNGDAPIISFIGADHTTDRSGGIHFQNFMLRDDANISAHPMLKAQYADCFALRDVTFWQPEGQVTAGHSIDATECWDWRLDNVIFRAFGTAGSTANGVVVRNSALSNSNDWHLRSCRFQQGQPGAKGVYFDSSNGSQKNFYFWFVQCKFEDTHNSMAEHVDGEASRVFFNQCEFGGTSTRHVNQPSTVFGWEFAQCLFTRQGVAATEQVKLAGVANSLIQSHLEPQGTTTTLNGAAASGQKVIPVTSTTGFTVGATVYLKKLDGSLSDTVLIASVSAGVSVTATSNLTNSYVSGDLLSTIAILQHVNLPAASGFDTTIADCYRPSPTTPLVNYDAPSNTKIRQIRSYQTEYGSSAQITSGNTSVVVTHGMGYTPRSYDIKLGISGSNGWGAASKLWYDTITSTQFTIHLDADPGVTVTINWHIDRVRG